MGLVVGLLVAAIACLALKLGSHLPISSVGACGGLVVLAHRAAPADGAEEEDPGPSVARPSPGPRPSSTPPSPTVVPAVYDLTGLEKSTRWRRSGTVVVLTTFGVLLVGLWGWGFDWVVFRGASPYPLEATVLLTAVLLGPAAWCLWTAYTDREGRYPLELSVDGRGLTLRFRRGEPQTWLWNDPRTRFSLVDLTGTDAYPSWVPAGYYLQGFSKVADRVWLPDGALESILTWARVAGADVGQWESTSALASMRGRAPPLGWLAYYVRGREGALRLEPP